MVVLEELQLPVVVLEPHQLAVLALEELQLAVMALEQHQLTTLHLHFLPLEELHNLAALVLVLRPLLHQPPTAPASDVGLLAKGAAVVKIVQTFEHFENVTFSIPSWERMVQQREREKCSFGNPKIV
jgi:hypothetical protein